MLAPEGAPLGDVRVEVVFRLDGGAVADAESSGTEGEGRTFERLVVTDADGAFRLGGLTRSRVPVRTISMLPARPPHHRRLVPTG